MNDKEILNHYNNIIELCKMSERVYGATFYLHEINITNNKEDLQIIYDTYRLQIHYKQTGIGKEFVKNNWNDICVFIKNNNNEIKKHLLNIPINAINHIEIDLTIIDKEKDAHLFKIINIHSILGE